PVQHPVGLGARAAHGGALGAVQQLEIDAGRVGGTTHDAVQRIDLPYQVALADTADGWIAGHLPDCFQPVGQQQGARTHTGRCRRRLAPGVPAAHHHNVKSLVHHGRMFIRDGADFRPLLRLPRSLSAPMMTGNATTREDTSMADGGTDTRTARISVEEALALHSTLPRGKLETRISKPITTARDLSLAYSPGVAEPCLHIARNIDLAYDYTTKGNMVAVISNGTAVLGLGNIGALAGKPVMEGKIALFKRFADIDGIDLEIGTEDVDEFVAAVRYQVGFGGINLEDIKAPECFVIEQRLRELMDIPVFHDDQHGT